ncbi:uracil-xanthine permease family protein [Cellulomonas denverensis]|uniref:Nitrate reductase n=1 Tax=Cellulomonas denverensis TaxID=264297 RepID=A0A7X6QZL1_9CELL|nr:solute carrier family 23 protein [Cellulomonas denverensis]NKY23201.1 nitrate reductase [Cellulomonas denverensis]GIG26713.1 nitrate reductase [Cellulomonas denverensis]
MSIFGWQVHGDGRHIGTGAVVAPDERLSWPRTIGIGMQHVVAMFGATFLVPLLTGFSPATTLLFSAIGTALFLIITGNRLPSYLGSSFAFIAPIGAATASSGQSAAMGGILVTGLLLATVGAVVHFAGARWIDLVMPPIVTGTIVALIGFNLAPAAWNNFQLAPVTAVVTLAGIVLVAVLFRGLLGRLSILVGVLIGYLVAVIRGEVDFTAVKEAAWFGLPDFVTPTFEPKLLGLFLPVVFVLIAENVGHVKSVAAMTGRNLDHLTGRALFADGVATTFAGIGGGSGTTTYAENIGVMAATRVYSTAAYWVAAGTALVLSLVPKFGALINTIPVGVLGGATTVLYGMIGILGARIWVQNKVDFSDPVNLTTAAVALVIGIANFTWVLGDASFEGIALGSAAAIVVYHVMRGVARWRGTGQEPASPASVPGGTELEH